MHSIIAIKHWGHHLHESMANMRHQISTHLHSRHFWTGVGVTLLIIGVLALLFTLAMKAPIQLNETHPYGFPYGPYH